MFNIFPFTNFHDLNMDWIIKSIKTLWSKAVFTVNNTMPDENGNVNLPTVAGVSSVNGIGADGQGNVQLSASNVGALKNTFTYISINDLTFSQDINTENRFFGARSIGGYLFINFDMRTTNDMSYGDVLVSGLPTVLVQSTAVYSIDGSFAIMDIRTNGNLTVATPIPANSQIRGCVIAPLNTPN